MFALKKIEILHKEVRDIMRQDNKILVTVKKNRQVKALELSLGNFGTVDLGIAVVPMRELDTWLKMLYGYKLLSIKYKGKIIKFN